MQPRKLTIQNFGPFIHESVDFGDFQEAGLFLITGKTGAGKTTIFDSITFALFGETSGQIRLGKEMRSTFASLEEETKVSFGFEHQSFYYEVCRSPEQELAKKRGEGTHIRTAKARLRIFNSFHQLQKEVTKISEVDRFIKELLHLNAKQFFQVILLPQGEFRNFLIASSNEKEKLLRNIFGTEIFQRLNEWLKQQQKLANQDNDALQIQLTSLQHRFVNSQPETILSTQESLLYRKDELKKIHKEIEQIKQELSQWKVKEKQAQDALYVAKELNKSLDEYEALKATEKKLFLDGKKKQQQNEQVNALVWLEKNQGLLEEIQQYEAECSELEKQLKQGKKEWDVLQSQKAEWNKEKEQVDQWEKEKEEKKQAQQRLLDLLPLAKEYQELAERKVKVDGQLKKNQKEFSVLKKQHAFFEEKEQKVTDILSKESQIYEDEIQLIGAKDAVEKLASVRAEKKQNEADITSNQQTIFQIGEQCKQTKDALEAMNQKIADLKNKNAKMQIARLSLDLQPGEPCPICGSVTHPAPALEHELYSVEEIRAIGDQLVEAEQQGTKLLSEKEQKETQLAYLKKQQQTLNKALEQKEIAFIEAKKSCQSFFDEKEETVETSIWENQLQKEKRELQSAKKERELIQNEKEKWQLQFDKQAEKEQELKKQSEKLNVQVDQLNRQLNGQSYEELIRNEKDLARTQKIVEEKITNYAQEGQRIKEVTFTLEERQKQQAQHLQSTQEKKEQARRLLTQKRTREPFYASENKMQEDLSKLTELPQLQAELKSYQEKLQFTQKRLAQLQEVKDKERPELEKIQEKYQQLNNQVDHSQHALYQKEAEQKNNETLIEEMENLYNKGLKKANELAELQQLSETMNGNNVKKISIERYVLQAYLAEILEVANQRLVKLSRGRYQFLLKDGMGSYKSSTGLEIDIYDDNAGTSRRAQTLSGGESFIAALALALSLADVIQNHSGGVAIEALFIDEGFGSLDEEALDMALEALEMVENEGRMIGIISHVRSLKEQIQQQIVVDAKGNGQSKIISKPQEKRRTSLYEMEYTRTYDR